MLSIQATGCQAGGEDGTDGDLNREGEDGGECSKGECQGVVGGEAQAGVGETCVSIWEDVNEASRQHHATCAPGKSKCVRVATSGKGIERSRMAKASKGAGCVCVIGLHSQKHFNGTCIG